MALIKCHECGSDVSSDAAACPKCGVKPKKPKPESKHLSGWQVVAGLIGGVVAIAFMAAQSPSSSSTPQERDQACRQDLQCWGGKAMSLAQYSCKEPIEKQAKHSLRWVDDGAHPMFAKLGWRNQAAGVVTFIGDRVEFQNGFCAFTRVTYSCDFDPSSSKVIGVRVFEGRLE